MTGGRRHWGPQKSSGQLKPGVLPLVTRLAIEIPKPKEWQAFQRNCVLLFRAMLNDDHAQEYGRGGQNQRGIDILARRNGDINGQVGIQCRLITHPLRATKIEEDARAALEHTGNLKELIFATTAPDDTHATNAALEIERKLRGEGYDMRIVVYSWDQLQTHIVQHDAAYAAFNPAAMASHASLSSDPLQSEDRIAEAIVRKLREPQGVSVLAAPAGSTRARDVNEDPALHARIDASRELLLTDKEPGIAERRLTALLQEDLTAKPWAHFRILTNLGAAALEQGREADGARRFEQAFEVLPADADALANLALARTIQGRYEVAMGLASKALATEPRSEAAVGYLLQAAARSDWEGDPQTLVPPDLANGVHAAMGPGGILQTAQCAGMATGHSRHN